MGVNDPLTGGRTFKGGPMAGGYAMFAVTIDNLAANETPEFDFKMPADGRIMEISVGAEVVVSDPAYAVFNAGAALTVANGDLTAAPVIPPLVAGARDFSKGDLISVNFNADAGDTATGVVVLITIYIKQHVNPDIDDD